MTMSEFNEATKLVEKLRVAEEVLEQQKTRYEEIDNPGLAASFIGLCKEDPNFYRAVVSAGDMYCLTLRSRLNADFGVLPDPVTKDEPEQKEG